MTAWWVLWYDHKEAELLAFAFWTRAERNALACQLRYVLRCSADWDSDNTRIGMADKPMTFQFVEDAAAIMESTFVYCHSTPRERGAIG